MTNLTWGTSNETQSGSGLERVDNHLYFSGEITDCRAVSLLKELRTVALENRAREGLPGEYIPIWLHINSGGGDAFASFAVADQISHLGVPVYSLIEGRCASGATLISLACAKRFMHAHAFFLIHQLSGASWGTYQQMQDTMSLHDAMMRQVTRFYMERSHLDEKKVKELLSRDIWLEADTCLEYGLVDKVL